MERTFTRNLSIFVPEKPTIGITLGDPAGIGSEILVKALPEVHQRCRPVLYGSEWSLRDGSSIAGVDLDALNISTFIDVKIPKPSDFTFGQVSAACGEVAVRAVETAAEDVISGKLDALMTCPLNKEAIHAAGYREIGHQEIFARLSNAKSTATMLMTTGLRVVHLSTHLSIIEAARSITSEIVLERLRLIRDCFEEWGLSPVRIGVAALNPHGGEGGLLGREEIERIRPAVEQAVQEGIKAMGPFPADSIFNRAIAGEFDVVLAMYHDQGHIAIKVHDFHQSISATLGLPFVRTSVDHGTAFDIAGRGIANHRSTIAAIDAAITLVTGTLGC
ncbi:MAG: 4-hydroxythreonine-4-phosphate dehydrogenase PdxA [Gammaproteobacteria bacterium]|nr:4-hydroxythreonine-4-phosphate dehydrogenase PdxA [Gammaproteobacteria bacterium]MYI76603.1 4-hydroxythreonine-4-phosphate dehydrogenase PdxA [Gammaproteobacteria bacterium]